MERAAQFAEALAELGGSILLVRPVPGAGDIDPLDNDAIGRLAACWEAVGRATAEHGVRLALHVDFLSALRRDDALTRCWTTPIQSSSDSRSTPAS